MGKNIGKNISKKLSHKYSPARLAAREKRFDHPKQSATDAFKIASKVKFQKTAEATGDLIDNKIVNRIMKVLKNSQKYNSETVPNEDDKEIPTKRYISPKIIDDSD